MTTKLTGTIGGQESLEANMSADIVRLFEPKAVYEHEAQDISACRNFERRCRAFLVNA